MKQYLDHMRNILDNGIVKEDRTGTGTRSIFGHQMRFDLRDGFPLVTTKKTHLKSIIEELLWFLRGETNINTLNASIWDEWASEDGELGPIYGAQWRSWAASGEARFDEYTQVEYHDQIANVIERLKTNPECRRLIVSAWNVGELEDMALMPCHVLFQFMAEPMSLQERFATPQAKRKVFTRDVKPPEKWHQILTSCGVPEYNLSCQLYQRSADWFLGVPFNIASYALLTMVIAKVVNMVPKDFIHSFGDTHLYSNHTKQAHIQLSRQPHALPTMNIKDRGQGIDDFVLEDFELVGYECDEAIKAPVAV